MRELAGSRLPDAYKIIQRIINNVFLEITTVIQAWQGYCDASHHGTGQCFGVHDKLRYSDVSGADCHNLSAGIWATIDTTATVTAQSSATWLPTSSPEYFAVTRGQQLNFISTSTSTGWVVLTEIA
jgi:hypothetical protein